MLYHNFEGSQRIHSSCILCIDSVSNELVLHACASSGKRQKFVNLCSLYHILVKIVRVIYFFLNRDPAIALIFIKNLFRGLTFDYF